MYDYREVVKEDIKTWIRDNMESKEFKERIEDDRDGFAEELNDKLWVDDSVTGNASGSYTFNSLQAKENLDGNLELLKDVASEWDINLNEKIGEWEYLDVSIRRYLLAECIESAPDELEDEEEETDGLFKLENEDGETVIFETLEEIGDYIADDSKGFGHLRAFALHGRLNTADEFDVMAVRKYGEDFTRVFPNFHYLIAEMNPNADELRGMTYLFTELSC